MIDCAQKPHNERIDSTQLDNYAIYCGGSVTGENEMTNTKIGRIAFVIHNSSIPNVAHINRINGRMMEIRPKTGKTYMTSLF